MKIQNNALAANWNKINKVTVLKVFKLKLK